MGYEYSIDTDTLCDFSISSFRLACLRVVDVVAC